MAVIEFKGYTVNKMIFEKNEHYVELDKGGLENSINFEVNMDESGKKAVITMGLVVGSTNDEGHPFFVDVELDGMFKYNLDQDETNVGFNEFLLNNGAAILYPYLRSTVSSLTNLSEFPAYVLPTINIASVISGE